MDKIVKHSEKQLGKTNFAQTPSDQMMHLKHSHDQFSLTIPMGRAIDVKNTSRIFCNRVTLLLSKVLLPKTSFTIARQ